MNFLFPLSYDGVGETRRIFFDVVNTESPNACPFENGDARKRQKIDRRQLKSEPT